METQEQRSAMLQRVEKVRVEARMIQIERVPIYYQVAGAGEPLVLVHGLSGSTRWWARNIEAFAQRFRVYVIDLIGFGASNGPYEFVLEKASEFLVSWMDRLRIERAHLVGHSMGGFISADLASDFPDRVDRLVLVDAVGMPFTPNYLQHAFGLVRALQHVPFNFLPVLLADAWRCGPSTLLGAARQILGSDLRQKLVRIQAPTLFVWGEYDTMLPVGVGREYSQLVADSEFVVLGNAGHNPMWDRPVAFNQITLEFLTGTSPSVLH